MATITTKTGRKINIKPKNTSSITVIDESAWGFSGIYEPPAQQTNYNMESQWDEFLSPVKWDVNYWQSFNYSTGTFANWNKPKWIAPTVSKTSTPSTVSWPSTFSRLSKPESTVMVWWVKKSKYLPETLELRQWDQIWIDKKEETPHSFDFNTQLSNLYWKWLTDKSAIFWELSKDKSFAALDSVKQQDYITQMTNNIKDMNEAKAKADMTNEKFDPAEYARLKGFDIQTWDVKEIQKGRKEITDTLKYQGSIYDNNAEDMKFKKEQTIKALDQNIEQTRQQVQRQTDDVMKQSQQTIAMWEKVGALKWYNKSGGYVQWLMNIQQEAMKNIQRLQQDLARAEMLTGEDKALAMQEYEKNMTRSKEEFDYKMRSVIAEWQSELWRLVMWKYDPKKLGEMLDNLSYDVIQKRMDIEAQYINNMKSANDVVSQQFDQYRAMDDYTDKQRQEFTSILNANDGEALASMSAKDIENFVSQGYLSQEQWAAYYQSMVSKTIGALSEYGIPTQNDIDTVINSIKNGLSPLQSVAWVVQSNPNRYSSVKDKFMTVWANSSIFNTQTGQFMTAPWATTWVSSTYTGKPIPAVAPQTVQQSVQRVTQQYTVWSKWWQCGSFVNNYLQNMWLGRMFVDPIDKKAQLSNSQTPTVWSVAIMDSPSSPQYGHVAIVTKVNPDWSFQTIESNKEWEEKVFTRTMKPWSAKYGFFDPTKWISTGTQNVELWIDDIISFNDDVTRRKMSKEEVKRIWDEKRKIMTNPKANIEDILMWSSWGKSVWAEQSKSFAKYSQAMWQLDWIQWQISKMNTWPILGKLRNINPYDTDAQVLKSQLTWLIPTIARWVYGEVWVLTDADVKLYAQTLPNLQGTQAKNEWVLAFTLDVLASWYKKQLSSLAWQWYDVSWLEWEYLNIKWQADALKNKLWINTPEQNAQKWQDLFNKVSQQALAKQGQTTTPTKTTTAPVNKDKEARLRALIWL